MQSAFLPGRNIMEGVVVVHETLHELHRRQQDGVVFKIDFEKAYDKVKWPFVRQTLRMKGFDDKWCTWVDAIMKKGHVAVKVNNYTGNTFETKKGLRQGDPLSSILFNIVVDMLAIIVKRAVRNNLVGGVVPHLVDEGIPMNVRRLSIADWRVIEERFEKKLSNWKMPRGVLEKLNYFRSRFFWQADNHKKKYRLVKWNIICQPKDQGGLGVKNLGVQNQCLLSKWLFKLINEEGMWQTMLKRKFKVNNGTNTRFWEDRRGLMGANLEAWFRLVSLVVAVQVNSAKDVGNLQGNLLVPFLGAASKA
eukprot:XP_008657698.1 uncharacterized protein LOC103637241 [Zea mays]